MRIAILSDIHANLPALVAVLEDLKARKPDGLIVAGDLTGGPSPDRTIDLLRQMVPSWMVIGNSDLNLLRFLDGQFPEICQTARQFALLRWGCAHISERSIGFLRSLPQHQVIFLEDGSSGRVVHGSLDDPYDGYDPDGEAEKFNRDLQRLAEGILICGHTHRSWVVERLGKLAFNPGSVAGPLNGGIGAQYALLEKTDGAWKVKLLTVPYDLSQIRKDFIESGLLETGGALARCFLYSIENGRDVSLPFFQLTFRLAEQAGYGNPRFIPDDIWDQAEASFNWSGYAGINAWKDIGVL